MANQKVPQLPVLSAVTGEDLLYIVDVSDTTDDPTGSSKQITRDDLLKGISGFTADTISATTYYNLPTDIRVTGGTYSGGTTIFTNNTGGTFSVSGFNTSVSPISVVNTSSLFSTGLSNTGLNSSGVTHSIFMGSFAGYQATGASASNFFGYQSGFNAIDAYESNFIGPNSGYQASGASASNFFGNGTGANAYNALHSNFIGTGAGSSAYNAYYSNFIGYSSGENANNASYSNLFGFNVGKSFPNNNIGPNNIIIGTNISLPSGTTNSINIGGVLFGVGTYSGTTGSPSISGNTIGRIGIGVVNPTERLHVSGNTLIQGGLTADTISATTYYNLPTDIRVTGGTYSSGTTTFTNNTGGTFNVSGYYTGSTVYLYEVHVSTIDGNDTTGDGSLLYPVATITKGLTLISGNRRTLIIHPGTYTESPSITSQYTVLTTFEPLGGNTSIVGTVSTSVGCTIAGLTIQNLTITANSGVGVPNVINSNITGTLTKSGNATFTDIHNCDIGTACNITGSGLVTINDGNTTFLNVNNVSANVIVKNSMSCVAPSLSAGTLNIVDSVVVAAVTNAVTSSAGSIITLANSQLLTSTLDNVAPVSLSGFYSIVNVVYNKSTSTLVGSSGTGGSTNSIVYSQYINADKFITQGGVSSQYVMGDGSLSNGFTGGTVSGATNFTNGLTANTISATTVYTNGFTANTTGVSATTISGGALNISGNTSEDLVRITQTGSGNALVVEDSSNPDSTPFVVNTSGFVGIGVTSPTNPLHISGSTDQIKLSNGSSVWTIASKSNGDFVAVASGTRASMYFGSYGTTNSLRIGSNGNIIVNSSSDSQFTGTGNVIINNVLSATTISATTISATTYQNLPTDVFVTGGTYTSGNAIFTNNTGGTFTVSGFSVGGGGGQVFYLNLSESQNGNRLLSTTASTASEQTSGVTIANGVTSTIASFQSQPLNITLLPGGVWSFYLHSYKQDNNASFNIFVEVYKRTSGGTETLLFATDPTAVTTNSPNPSMQLSDGYFSGTSLNVSDSVVAVVRATNTDYQSHTITLVTEGSTHYSYVVSTIPTQQGLTCDTLSGCSIIQTIQTDISNKFDKSGGTVNGNLTVTGNTSLQAVTATTISATTISGTTFYGDGTNLTGVVKGSGTANYLPRWTGTTGLGNSQIQDDGTYVSISTSTALYGLQVYNSTTSSGGVGIRTYSDSGVGNQTGLISYGAGNIISGTSVGVYGFGVDGLLAIGVKGDVGNSEFGGVTTGIGGYFDGRGEGTYGYPSASYSVQLIDGTEGLNKVLVSQTSDGKANWVDPSTIQTAFNYGLANAIMTGNFLT